MKEEQLNLFDDSILNPILPSLIKDGEAFDLSKIDIVFDGESEFTEKMNLSIKRLNCLPRGRFFIFKNKNGAGNEKLNRPAGYPYVKNMKKGNELTTRITRDGKYPVVTIPLHSDSTFLEGVTIRKCGKRVAAIDFYMHKLVGLFFLQNPNTSEYHTIDHVFNKDKGYCDSEDYRPEHLEWLPMGENTRRSKTQLTTSKLEIQKKGRNSGYKESFPIEYMI